MLRGLHDGVSRPEGESRLQAAVRPDGQALDGQAVRKAAAGAGDIVDAPVEELIRPGVFYPRGLRAGRPRRPERHDLGIRPDGAVDPAFVSPSGAGRNAAYDVALPGHEHDR